MPTNPIDVGGTLRTYGAQDVSAPYDAPQGWQGPYVLAARALRANRSQGHPVSGWLLAHNARAAGRYVIDVVEDPATAAGIRVTWMARPEWHDWARWSEGFYVLRTNILDWSPEDLWRTYVQLTDAEAAFRIQKSDLALRPIWHQRADRVQAHILVCFLAYVLWKTLEQWQQQASLGHSPRTILAELPTIQSTDVVLPTADAREVRLRCVVRPNRAQALLLDRLGLDLPHRLRMTSPLSAAVPV